MDNQQQVYTRPPATVPCPGDYQHAAKAPPPPPTDKHLLLYNAIKDMDAVSNSLGLLIDRARGSEEPRTAEEEGSQTPSLVELLNHGPALVQGKLDALNKQIDELNELLF